MLTEALELARYLKIANSTRVTTTPLPLASEMLGIETALVKFIVI